MKTLFATIFLFFTIIVVTILIILSVKFNQNCGGYINRAADSNSIEMAKAELLRAIIYLENKGDTIGYTSVLWRTPDEDIGFWYHNLKSSYKQLDEINPQATELEKTNVLMKLRETLLDDSGDSGDEITKPAGISKYPHNAFWGIVTVFAVITLSISLVLFMLIVDDL